VDNSAFFFLKMGEQQVTENQIRKSILFFCRYEQKERTPYWPIGN
jgi:hypothetical protein